MMMSQKKPLGPLFLYMYVLTQYKWKMSFKIPTEDEVPFT